ncbi:excinuclease ATPase subunit [Massilia sp. CFBP9012]|uniref:excinuclease ATPase subunit n=1 Tax=Massilia sp. CFBP9012 TaxID=3096531 RepID=UPI002A698F3A|nr:excinuclease ATPase subunit [Massilia sp. CFBP9012]MDY0973653.1 excinuclease ATPase subunit [Massilia sp. CFBP9012]
MKKLVLSLTTAAALFATIMPSQARDTVHMMPIDAALDANDARARLGDSIKYYFGDQKTPAIVERLGSDKTSQKTNSFGKSAETSCNWVFLSAMLRLQARAQELGANAVVNIVSNYKNIERSSATEFECHDGAIMTGVALKADFVKIK